MNNSFSTYSNLKGYKHTGDITLDDIISQIKNNPNRSIIDVLRSLPRESPAFKTLKESLPIFTPHTITSPGQKADNRSIRLSGYLYIDIDEDVSNGIELIRSRPEVAVIFRSVSNRGYGVLVKASVSGDFTSAHRSYMDMLGIKYDPNALGRTRGCIISQDDSIYVNENPIELTLSGKADSTKEESKKRVINSGSRSKKSIWELTTPSENTFKIRYQTQLSDEDYAGQPYVFIPEGFPYYKIWLGMAVDGNRHRQMMANLMSTVIINPTISYDRLLVAARYYNTKMESWSDDKVISLVKWVWKINVAGTLKQKPSRMKKVWFADKCGLSSAEKQKITRKLIGSIQTDKTKQKINDAIEELQSLDPKITQKSVAKHIQMSLDTVKNHWSDFKELVQDLNSYKIR